MASKDPVVAIAQGLLKGRTAEDHKGVVYYSFQGIPYAKPPLGELRFKSPQPPEKWNGIRDATKEGNICFSRHMITTELEGDEDCLFINVYTPSLPDKHGVQLKPVMFWIHGGGFIMGSGNTDLYGPEFLVAEDIVLVTFNYRTGVLGFLSIDDPSVEIPGNAGLRDQVMALRWVQENIANFGGDPNCVTIFGESAGGASVHLLLLSPMTRGLFHRAIAQSGSSLNPWVLVPGSSAEKIAALMQCESKDPRRIIKFLREQPVEKLFRAQHKLLFTKELRIGDINATGPRVEIVTKEQPFLAEHPEEIIKRGEFHHVPFMTGCTTSEGMLMLSPTVQGLLKPNFTRNELLTPRDLSIQLNSSKSARIGAKIKQFYYGDEQPTEENISKYIDYHTDALFLNGVYKTAKLHAEKSTQPVFYYEFALNTELNVMKKLFNADYEGVCHADDLGYLFKNMATPETAPGSPENIARDRVVKLWTNFAKTGNPTPSKDFVLNIKWTPVTKNEFNYLRIDTNLSIKQNVEEKRMNFWENLYKEEKNKCYKSKM